MPLRVTSLRMWTSLSAPHAASSSRAPTRSVFAVLFSLALVQSNTAIAQGAAPSEVASNEALKACDLAAASPYDKQRPADVPGVLDRFNPASAAYGTLNSSAAIPACEAAVRAAPQDPRMLYQLARSYRDAKRYADALPPYQQADQMGYAAAAFDLSVMYKLGRGVAADPKSELSYLDRAARQGHTMAESEYGLLYIKGSAVLPKDEALGRQLISLAAQDNMNSLALSNKGYVLAKGIGGNKDEVEATYWYEKAANAGDYQAMNAMALRRLDGIGGKKDLAEARQWFEKAANGNDPPAMYSLGMMIFRGDGGYSNYVEARKWFEKSANANNSQAMNSLGVMFEHGYGGPKDLDEARRMYRKAIALGNKDLAMKNLEKLDAAASR